MATLNRKTVLACAVAASAVVLCALPISAGPSVTSGIAMSVDRAQAEVGRPGTPGSVAGAHRRSTRRAVRRCAAGVTCNTQ